MSDYTDAYGRVIDYMRISVTDRCNERCLYCMPEGYKGWSQRGDRLTPLEIQNIVSAASEIGFSKFRLTGGEPLIRGDIVEIVEKIKSTPGVVEIGMSTNGARLDLFAGQLCRVGLDAVNISLDSLDPAQYHEITGGDLAKVLSGIDAALELRFKRIKLNCVLMKGVNEGQLWPIVEYATARKIPVCFIELMPTRCSGHISASNFMTTGDAMKILEKRDLLLPAPQIKVGNGPARYYHLAETGALVGFIGAMTHLNFCSNCNKVRLTSDGKIRPCLGSLGEVDLKGLMYDREALHHGLKEAVAAKPLKHEFACCGGLQGRPMTAIGG